MTIMRDSPVFFLQVIQRIDEDEHRIKSYLHISTLDALIERVVRVLLQREFKAIYDETKIVLRDEKYEGR